MKKSLFNLSYDHPMSFNMGELIPCRVQEAVPGDVFRGDTSALIRTLPLLAPVMHKVRAQVMHVFCPYRLIWPEFDDFITTGEDGEQAPIPPTIELSYTAGTPDTGSGVVGGLADYLRMPPMIDGLEVSALAFRAYALFYNQYIRDEQLQDEVAISLESGPDTTTNTDLLRGCWKKDYFTNARPNSQLGSSVTIPLTGDAPVIGNGTSIGLTDGTSNYGAIGSSATTGGVLGNTATYGDSVATTGGGANDITNVSKLGLTTDPDNSGMIADMSEVTGVDIRDLRLASILQRSKELLNRAGARPVEFYKAFYNAFPGDARMDRIEYLGGGTQTIQFSEVLQTAEGDNPVGELRGHGISAGRSNRFKYKVNEFGLIMSFIIVRPETMYMQGLPRMYSKNTRYEYLIPMFANIGDQAVRASEIYATGNPTNDNAVWAFTPRYDEYRKEFNAVSGEYRTTLNFWHMARDFGSAPVLNADFVQCNPTNRIYAVSDSDQLQVKIMNYAKVKRCLPKVARPRLS